MIYTLVAAVIIGLAIAVLAYAASGHLSAADYETAHIVVRDDDTPAPAADEFTVLTWNIGYASGLTNNLPGNASREEYVANLDTIVGILKNHEPDIAALQEVDFDCTRSYDIDQLEYIRQRTPYAYAAKVYDWNVRYVPFPYWPLIAHFRRVVAGQVILSRRPVEHHERIRLPKPTEKPFIYRWFYPDRLAQTVRIDMAGRLLTLMNVHLEAWGRLTREAQAHIAAELAAAEDCPLIVTGDFNATYSKANRTPDIVKWHQTKADDYETVQAFLDIGLQSAFPDDQQYGPNEAATYTFRAEWPHIALDHIFHSGGLEPISVRVLQDTPPASDHYPVIARYRFTS